MAGTSGAQVLTLLAAPILARLYSPDAFGIASTYVAIVTIVAVAASGRYELAIALPRSEKRARSLAGLCMLLSAICSAVLLSAVGVYQFLLVESSQAGYIKVLIWLFPVSVLAVATYNTMNYYHTRGQNFSVIAKSSMLQTALNLTVQLLSSVFGTVGIALGQFIGQLSGGIFLSYKSSGLLNRNDLRLARLLHVAKYYRKFPMYSVPEGIFYALGTHMAIFAFTGLYGLSAAGQYVLAHRVLAAPSAVIGRAVGQVFLSRAAEARREGHMGALISAIQIRAINMGIAPAIFLVLFGDEVFAVTFGETWRPAGRLSTYMAPWILMSFVYAPISTIFGVMSRQQEALVMQVVLMISRGAALTAAYLIGGFETAVSAYAAVSAVCYLLFNYRVAIVAQCSLGAVVRGTWCTSVLATIALLGSAIAGSYLDATPSVTLLALAACLFISYRGYSQSNESI